MDDRRHGGAYAAQPNNPPYQQPLVDSYPSKRSPSYRRPADAQPLPAQAPAPGPYNAVPSNAGRTIANSAPAPVNGLARVASQRRRQAQQLALGQAGGDRDALPLSPDAPRGPPPTSYRDPYARGSRAASGRHSGRSREPTIQTIPRQQPTIQSPSIQIAPERLRTPADQASLDGSPEALRRPSVPDRSPLQKLEGKLDDISKEERRNRIQELELEALEKAEAEARARRALEAAVKQQRNVSGPVAVPKGSETTPSRAPSGRRHVSMPVQARQPPPQDFDDTESNDGIMYDLSDPWDPTGGATAGAQFAQSGLSPSASQRQRNRQSYVDSSIGRVPSSKGKEPAGVSRGQGSFRHRNAVPIPSAQPVSRKPVAAPKGLGLYDVADAPQADIMRQGSRRYSRDMAPASQDSADRRRDSRGIMSAQMEMEQQRLDYKNSASSAPQPPPQHYDATAPQRRSVGFASTTSHRESGVSQSTHDGPVPDVFQITGDPERTYQPVPGLQEWKSAPLATLIADDLDLDAPETAEQANKAWWEENNSRRRHSGGYVTKQPGYDGYIDEPTGQTSFNPPLYLKCGPLLRYTGMRKDKSKPGKPREIWRGSVMIVTLDAQSQYSKPPTLRLFKQPMDLLPPPPDEVDEDGQLNPAYIDPLEGQTHISRSGKTLYVKPIEQIAQNVDLSRVEDDSGLFQATRISTNHNSNSPQKPSRVQKKDGEKLGKVKEIQGIRLHAERGVTFWRFNIEIELGSAHARIAYRINRGPAIGFWVPARGEPMNIMFHSCNGFSYSVDSSKFCGPDPMWRDVLNNHQTQPFHVMLGGGDQIYNDAATRETVLFRQWTDAKNPLQKHRASFSSELQNELEQFYLDRYCMWFSQGLFGMANSQIPMVNMWDDHDIIDGYGSYPHHFMSTPVFMGLGAVAFKYYLLFQHQSVVAETKTTEPSWLIGAHPGPYIKQQSRSVFMFLGRQIAFLGLDCRTERQRDEIMTDDSYDVVFDRLEDEIVEGETKHLIVLLGVPIAYPRLNFLENILTSRVMDPIKAIGRTTGLLGNLVNKFDGGVEILDDLDDHWTAKHHKFERNWFIKELQHIAKSKNVRVTILSGDVHLAAVGQFYTNKSLNVPKDRDHRYMPNIISSAIVNTPPPDMLADILNKRNKVHHLDAETDEDMIPLFTHDVDLKKRNNTHLLPHRNWCNIREYKPKPTLSPTPSPGPEGARLSRRLSDFTPGNMVRRLSEQGPRGRRRNRAPPVSYYNNPAYADADHQQAGVQSSFSPDRDEKPRSRRHSLSSLFRRRASVDSVNTLGGSVHSLPEARRRSSLIRRYSQSLERPAVPRRRSSLFGRKKEDDTADINLDGGLEVCINVEVSQHDPAGITEPYWLLIPALHMGTEDAQPTAEKQHRKSRFGLGIFGGLKGRSRTIGDDGYSHSGSSIASQADGAQERDQGPDEEEQARQRYKVGPRILIPGFSKKRREKQLAASADASADYADAPSASGGADRRMSVDQGGHRRNFSAPMAPFNATPALPPENPGSAPGRSPSMRQPTHNSSHKSQLPAAQSQDASAEVHRRSMGGILNHDPDEYLPHKHAHSHSHAVSHSQAISSHHPSHPQSHAAAHAQAHSSHHASHLPQHTQHHQAHSSPSSDRRSSKRDTYPPHPAIVGTGPGSPYTRGTVEARDEPSRRDSRGQRDSQHHRYSQHTNPDPVSPITTLATPRSRGDGYFVRNPGGNPSGFNGSAGVGARYLGGGRYEGDAGAYGGDGYSDVSDLSDDDTGAGAGVGPGGMVRTASGRYYGGSGEVRGGGGQGKYGGGEPEFIEGGMETGQSQESFVPPKGKSRWKIWR